MADIKRTTEGLKHCLARYDDGLCDDCPYVGEIDRSYMIPMKCKEIIMRDALELLKSQQAEIDRLKAEKDEIIRKIGHARIDNIAPTDAKSTEVIYKHGVIDGLAYAQDIVTGKDGEQDED